MNDEIQELGSRIRSRRRSAGLSQEELAALIGIRRETLAKYEAGKIDMPVSQYLKLRRVLGDSECRELQLAAQREAAMTLLRELTEATAAANAAAAALAGLLTGREPDGDGP